MANEHTTTLRTRLRAWLPPALDPLARSLLGNVRSSGDYATWQEAAATCSGYAAPEILERVQQSALAVKRGEAAYEQDGVLFQEPDYAWPLVANLLWIASQRGAHLRVLDFGGSLGSTYYRHLPLLEHLQLSWSIVEQPGFVRAGRELFQDERLRFFDDVASCVAASRPDVVLLSGVLHYLPEPRTFLRELMAHSVPHLLFDTLPFAFNDRDRICVQRVKEPNYPGSYPAWLFSRSRFMETIEPGYRLLREFASPEGMSVPGECRGMLFARR